MFEIERNLGYPTCKEYLKSQIFEISVPFLYHQQFMKKAFWKCSFFGCIVIMHKLIASQRESSYIQKKYWQVYYEHDNLISQH